MRAYERFKRLLLALKGSHPHLTTCMKFRPRPHEQLFRYGYGHCPHVYDVNDDRKRNFSKTLSRVEFLKTIP